MKKYLCLIASLLALSVIADDDVYSAKQFQIDIGAQHSTLSIDDISNGVTSYSLGCGYFLTKYAGIGLDFHAPFPNDHPRGGKFLLQAASLSGIVRYPIGRFAPYALAGGGRDFHEGEYTVHAGAGLELRLHRGLGAFVEGRYVLTMNEPETIQFRAGLRVAKW